MPAIEPSDRATHVGPQQPRDLADWAVAIGGMVRRPFAAPLRELAASAGRKALTSRVQCPDGVGTAGATFDGVRLADLIEQAQPDGDARYVCIHSGAFTEAFPRGSIRRRGFLLADRRNGQPLTWLEGGPLRLVVARGACSDTVKWVERVTLERDRSSATAASMIRARRAAQPQG